MDPRILPLIVFCILAIVCAFRARHFSSRARHFFRCYDFEAGRQNINQKMGRKFDYTEADKYYSLAEIEQKKANNFWWIFSGFFVAILIIIAMNYGGRLFFQ